MRSEKVKISVEVPAHSGGDVREITITEPTGKQLLAYGTPFKTRMEGEQPVTEIDFVTAKNYLIDCADVPITSIEKLPIKEASECVGVIANFLMESETVKS